MVKESGPMIYEPILEHGVFRFDCSEKDKKDAFPSLSFQDPKVRDTPLELPDKCPKYIPKFESENGQQNVTIVFPEHTSFYGTGEVTGQLERTEKRISTWNTDSYGYDGGYNPLYQSHPWVLVVFPNGASLGVLAETTRRCEIDLQLESTILISSAAPFPIITFGPFASPTDVLLSLSRAIGTVFMPPKWALGYHQSRWSYDSDTKVRQIAKTFRDKKIPCDVIWMDIDYMDGFRCFTFDKKGFPNPKSLVDDLHRDGFNASWMLDPGIKKDEKYFVYQLGSEADIWIQAAPKTENEKPEPYVGKVWPGECVFPDFTQSKARSLWANLVKDFCSNGVDGIWNDMNEPAIFESETKTMPETNIHRGDPELGGTQKHSHYHNVYGMLMARSTHEGTKLANAEKRPFVLTRAGYLGSQRYAATWTGDNSSSWNHLHMSIPMMLQLGMSGQPLSGPDIGGFARNATPELFARWMGIGSMLPFCRAHSEKDSVDHEPWSFTKECEDVCRRALERRYRLLPHIYTLVYMAHKRGIPVATPTFFADPKDMELRAQENAFLLGPLLIYARTKKTDNTKRKLPKGIWRNFDFQDSHKNLPKLYLQGGSIIPVGPSYQHTGHIKPTDDLTLIVVLKNGKAEGILFEDDGDGYGYTRGDYLLTTYVAEEKIKSHLVTLKVSKTEGQRKRPIRWLHVILLRRNGAIADAWGVDGEPVTILLKKPRDVHYNEEYHQVSGVYDYNEEHQKMAGVFDFKEEHQKIVEDFDYDEEEHEICSVNMTTSKEPPVKKTITHEYEVTGMP